MNLLTGLGIPLFLTVCALIGLLVDRKKLMAKLVLKAETAAQTEADKLERVALKFLPHELTVQAIEADLNELLARIPAAIEAQMISLANAEKVAQEAQATSQDSIVANQTALAKLNNYLAVLQPPVAVAPAPLAPAAAT